MPDLFASITTDPVTLLVIGGLMFVALLGYVVLVVAGYFKHRGR